MTHKIYPNVKIGNNAKIGDFVTIGLPPAGKGEGELATEIGDNAVIRSHTVIYAGNKIGNNFHTGHYTLVREDNRIGDNVSVGSYSHVAFNCVIGDRVRVHTSALIFENSILKEGCWIGPGVMLANAKYPASVRAKEFVFGCEIGAKAKLGMGVIVSPGVKIGKNALIGLGAVVTKDIPPDSVAVGFPAEVKGKVSELKYPDGELAYPSDSEEENDVVEGAEE
ncbi:MAG TPA: transferase [Nanoarchaeota archaeon]|nr:MAG: acetyltransferase [archaeon GW2011_AR6]MBS3083130.1 transferase [Candidatus Pacearchaeota archaeon]HIH34033.1 transferase [Nanoarchaeota archaeon]HIH51647.1 transferase [Nanoarchaeota archaeon]HIH66184.1 transferase [Nanoarchaeota archaeon]